VDGDPAAGGPDFNAEQAQSVRKRKTPPVADNGGE
jgi:hypothetical protein